MSGYRFTEYRLKKREAYIKLFFNFETNSFVPIIMIKKIPLLFGHFTLFFKNFDFVYNLKKVMLIKLDKESGSKR